MKSGDIVLVRYPFTDFSDEKLRPALVLLPEDEEGDYLLAFITSIKLKRNNFDLLLTVTKENGLRKDSVLRMKKIMAVHKSLILGKIGTVSIEEWNTVKFNLKVMFGLD